MEPGLGPLVTGSLLGAQPTSSGLSLQLSCDGATSTTAEPPVPEPEKVG
jgi:hypothetical protein